MNRSYRGYQPQRRNLEINDITSMINKTPALTQMGAVCLICGKFVGLLAIPCVFIPELNCLAVFLLCSWGGLVFSSIALCSYEHFREKKIDGEQEKLAFISDLLHERPELKKHLADSLQEEEPKYELEDVCQSQKVIRLYQRH